MQSFVFAQTLKEMRTAAQIEYELVPHTHEKRKVISKDDQSAFIGKIKKYGLDRLQVDFMLIIGRDGATAAQRLNATHQLQALAEASIQSSGRMYHPGVLHDME